MAVDERYQDNLVITKDAFQNLLTNVKNYPIIDIDYVTETDTDELHGDAVWPNYTSGMPCIKITYGDDRTTKGNIIFAEEQRVLINKYKKILNQLKVLQNEYERLKNRWDKIYRLNYEIYNEKQNQINRYLARFSTIEVNKLAFLKAGWNLLQYNLVDLFDPEINDERSPLLKLSDPEQFQYQEFLGPDNFDYKKVLLPDHNNGTINHNLEYIVLNEEQKAKIIDTLTIFRDIQIKQNEEDVFFFSETDRKTINSFISFIASFNYFAVLEAIGVAGYNYTSDQILIIKNNKVQINDSNVVAAFEPVGNSATYTEGINYYKPEYNEIYVNIGNADYNGTNTYYLLNNDLSYSQYTYTDQNDFNNNRHKLFLKQQDLFCYRLVDIDASTFDSQKNNLYIQSSNSETMPAAVRAILPQIVDDIVWENLDNINLNFDSVYHEFSANIQNIINTLNTVVNPRLEIIEGELAKYINILNATEFTVEDSINVFADEENIYNTNPIIDESMLADHLLDDPEAIKFKIQVINKIINNCNQLIEEIATGKKDKDGNPLDDGDNRILYGYKYVKVGSNITFDHNLGSAAAAVKESYEAQYPGYTYPEVDPNSEEAQRTGTFRIDINGHTYEIGIQGLVGGGQGDINLSTGGDIYLTPSDDDDQETTGKVIVDGDLIPALTETYLIGNSDYKWLSVYGVNGYFDNLLPLDSGDSGTETNIGNSTTPWTNAYITNINSYNSTTHLAAPTGSTVAGDTGYFNNIYINGNEIDTTDLDDVVNGTNGTTATFWRGDASWSNTLTGSLTTAGLTSSGVVNITNSTAASSTSTGALIVNGGIGCAGYIYGSKVYGAVFNDYAEYRTTINLEAGRVVIDNDDGSLSCSSSRLQPGAQVISDTFGHSMGETEIAKTPIAVAGRVLVYTYQPRENYHAGMAVCSAPNGTIDIMTREEIRDYPDCIVGIVSEIPQYEIWGSDNVKVDGRIWIKVK